MGSSQIWQCHVIQTKNLSFPYLKSYCPLSFRKSHQISWFCCIPNGSYKEDNLKEGRICPPPPPMWNRVKKVTKLIDIITPALVVFERVVSGALKNGVISDEEFNTLQTLHLETLIEIDWYCFQDGSRAQVPSRKKPIGRDKRAKKNAGIRV